MTPSSSRQGSLCTNASIWYLALMNSDLMGLCGAHRRKWRAEWEKLITQPPPGSTSQTTQPLPPRLQPDSLDFVLRVGFAPATLHLRGVQQGMLPDGVGSIAGERVHHLQGEDAN